MIGLRRNLNREGLWTAAAVCDACCEVPPAADALVLWDEGKPDDAVTGFVIVCGEACVATVRGWHPELAIGGKPLSRFLAELAIYTQTQDEVARDLAFAARQRWGADWHVEARAKRGGKK